MVVRIRGPVAPVRRSCLLHINFSQAFITHHDLMHRQRVQKLVGDDDPLERVRERIGR